MLGSQVQVPLLLPSISYPSAQDVKLECCAGVVELVDTPDLGSGAARCESSSLSFRTIYSRCLLRRMFQKALLGYRQAVRHWVLISAFQGSNPCIPAILNVRQDYWDIAKR